MSKGKKTNFEEGFQSETDGGREEERAHGNQTDEWQEEKRRQNERQSERDKCVQLLSAPL